MTTVEKCYIVSKSVDTNNWFHVVEHILMLFPVRNIYSLSLKKLSVFSVGPKCFSFWSANILRTLCMYIYIIQIYKTQFGNTWFHTLIQSYVSTRKQSVVSRYGFYLKFVCHCQYVCKASKLPCFTFFMGHVLLFQRLKIS